MNVEGGEGVAVVRPRRAGEVLIKRRRDCGRLNAGLTDMDAEMLKDEWRNGPGLSERRWYVNLAAEAEWLKVNRDVSGKGECAHIVEKHSTSQGALVTIMIDFYPDNWS